MKMQGLAVLSLVIIVSSGLATSKLTNNSKKKVVSQVLSTRSEKFVAIPTLTGQSYPMLSAQAALAIDLTSGVALYEKDPDKLLLPASTTKIVTALVAMDYYTPGEILTVPNIKSEGQRMRLIFGEKLSVDSLLKGLLISSANDAAEVLASEFPGWREAFISAMNTKARQLNLTNINELLGKVDGVAGVKTGWTENARENLVTYIERDGRKIMIALLGSQDRFGETKELIEWIFGNYEWREVAY